MIRKLLFLLFATRAAFAFDYDTAKNVTTDDDGTNLSDCVVEYLQTGSQCYISCDKNVTLMQRIVKCPLLEVPCGPNGTIEICPSPPMPPSPSPPSPLPPLPPSPLPPHPPSPPPPVQGGGSCSWFCNPCDNCKKNPLFPKQCIYFGGTSGQSVGNCTVKEDCIFGNVIIRKGDNLNDTSIMGKFAAPPDQWTCVPGTTIDDATNGVSTCTFGECELFEKSSQKLP
jgi:hypothetical protein